MARYPNSVYRGNTYHELRKFTPTATNVADLVDELRRFANELEADESFKDTKNWVSLGEEIHCEREHEYSDYGYYGSSPEGNNALAVQVGWTERASDEQIELAKEAVDKQRAADKIRREKAKKKADAAREKELRALVKKNRAELEKLLKESE